MICFPLQTGKFGGGGVVHGAEVVRSRTRNNLFAAAAATISFQLCPTLCDPIDGSPPGSPIPGIFQARVLEWDAIAFSALDCSPFLFRMIMLPHPVYWGSESICCPFCSEMLLGCILMPTSSCFLEGAFECNCES